MPILILFRAPPLRRRLLAVTVAFAAAAVAATGCVEEGGSPSVPSVPATGGLVLLAGSAAADALMTWDAAGNRSDLPVPDPSAGWLTVSRRGALLATLADGSLRMSTRLPIPGGETLTWRPVPSVDADLPDEPLYFATWAPNGLVVATIATDRGAQRSLTIVDPIGDATLIIPLEASTVVLPPAWLDVDRVVVPEGSATTIVDTTTGDTLPGPGGVALLTVSADGSRAAFVRTDTPAIEIRLAAEWLAGAGRTETSIQTGDARVAALALDRRADRLAVVWDRDGGEAGLLTVYRRDGTAWTEAERMDLPGGADRGVAGWLP